VPRPNQPRSIADEANVAEWVIFERKRRKLSYDALAKAMTKVGCPITGTAIFRIEKGNPRRVIGVNELAAFAKVFDVEVTKLLASPDLARTARGRDLVEKTFRTYEALPKTVYAFSELVADIRELAEQDPEVYEYFQNQWLTKEDGLTGAPLEPTVWAKLVDLVNTVVDVHSQPGAHPRDMPVRSEPPASGKQRGKARIG
jgi:transcriptional regulator with XRE-family HTH domain